MKLIGRLVKFCTIPVVFLIALCECDCGATLTPQQSASVTLGVDAVVCILNHVTAPATTIAQDCLGDPTLISDVTKVLAAHYAAEARESGELDAGMH